MSEERGFYEAAMRGAQPFDAGALIGAAGVDAATQALLRDLAAENDALRKSNAELRAMRESLRAQIAALLAQMGDG